MSIDAPSAEMSGSRNISINFNYIDTFVEYVAEVILKYDNAIPESKDRQQKELQQHKQFVLVSEKTECLSGCFYPVILTPLPRSYADRYAYQFIKEINPPPPKA